MGLTEETTSVKVSEYEFVARCAGGFEAVLAQELRGLGIRRVRPLRGSVSFFGGLRDGYRACLWSRVATRILMVIARVAASDADELYAGVVALPWERELAEGATIAVEAHGTSQTLRNTQFIAVKVKDALCDRLRERRGTRPDVDAKNPDLSINVSLREGRATISLNLSGASLHRRGYRREGVQTEAPLKETLAAGILLSAGWEEIAEQGGTLVDPMCGSGTFAIEGALMAAHMAPGLLRERWGFAGWRGHDERLWRAVRDEARARAGEGLATAAVVAGDRDEAAVAIARENAVRAGVSHLIRFYVDDAAHLGRQLRGVEDVPGLLAANPPYGIRLLSQDALPQVHDALAAATDSLPSGWRVALVTPDLGIDTALGRMPAECLACHNGPIEAWVRRYDLDAQGPLTHRVVSLAGVERLVRIADPASAQFAGRLRKVAKERARWARAQGLSCYRIYDADLPDYPVSVDLYGLAGGGETDIRLVIEERPRRRSVDVQRAGRHFADAVALASATLGVPRSSVVQRPWLVDTVYDRAHEAAPASGARIEESGYVFEVDLGATLGGGLPLELREVRRFVGTHAAGARFANLFGAGGAATVCAAGGGARSSVTVDSSRKRLDWVAQALDTNHLAGGQHGLACKDVRDWLVHEQRRHHVYDLVLCSPPLRLAGRGSAKPWSLDKDLAELLRLVGQILSRSGQAVLVLPAQGPAPAASPSLAVEDASARMLPHDFARMAERPRVFLLRKA